MNHLSVLEPADRNGDMQSMHHHFVGDLGAEEVGANPLDAFDYNFRTRKIRRVKPCDLTVRVYPVIDARRCPTDDSEDPFEDEIESGFSSVREPAQECNRRWEGHDRRFHGVNRPTKAGTRHEREEYPLEA